MASIQNVFVTPSVPGRLRPFDPRRDMGAVADLVEQCFNETIDPDGKRYLRQMRSAAQNFGFMRRAGAFIEQHAMPLSGYVWEEDGRVVGNLSLIPFSLSARRHYLIANVAVHPNHRRRGIARELTRAALDYARKQRSGSSWLHVREDNEAALRLYQSMGFHERTRRTTWHSYSGATGVSTSYPEIERLRELQKQNSCSPRRKEHWQQQRSWLETVYPYELSWHFPFDWTAIQPGLLGIAQRLLTGSQYQHWSVLKERRLAGVLTRQRSMNFADYLWLAVPPDYDEDAIISLMRCGRQHIGSRRPLTLDLPAHMAEAALRETGFQIHQTLIWMENRFE